MLNDLTTAVIAAGARARQETLDDGVPVFYSDASGMEILEEPDGRRYEIRYIPGAPRERLFEIVREISRTAA